MTDTYPTDEDAAPESSDDWIADFGATPKSDVELEALRSALTGDANLEMRQLVAEAQCMRWAARVLLQRLRDVGAWPVKEDRADGAVRAAAWLLERREPAAP